MKNNGISDRCPKTTPKVKVNHHSIKPGLADISALTRHCGIIIEPAEQEKKSGLDGEAPRSTGSKSRSRSATPSSKGKERVRGSNSTSPTTLHPGTAAPASGHSSYYRQHTATTTGGTSNHVSPCYRLISFNLAFVPPRAPQPVMDPQYAQVGLPTSATRLNSATNWGHPHPWPEGPPQMGPISYHPIPGQHPVYYASPYYRPNGAMIPHPQPLHPPELAPNIRGVPNGSSSHSPPQDHNISRGGTPMHNPNHDVEMTTATSHTPNEDPKPSFVTAPVIDPSLDSSTNTSSVSHSHAQMSSEQIKAISLEITQAAMEAVLESAKAEVESRNSRTPNGVKVQDGVVSKGSNTRQLQEGEADADGDADEDEERAIASQLASEDKSNGIHGYGRALERPEPMEHMLTEDGEPMLNPGLLLIEFVTACSLTYPCVFS